MRIIAGQCGGAQLYAPRGMDTRPTQDKVKESLFSIIQAYVPGARVLDLFAGSGALALEALSRGADFAAWRTATGKRYHAFAGMGKSCASWTPCGSTRATGGRRFRR